jgi:hypothetical protein
MEQIKNGQCLYMTTIYVSIWNKNHMLLLFNFKSFKIKKYVSAPHEINFIFP